MTLSDVMKDTTAGDPISGLKWSRKALRKISLLLRFRRCRISAPTVSRLLLQDGYSLHVNSKRLTGPNATTRNLVE